MVESRPEPIQDATSALGFVGSRFDPWSRVIAKSLPNGPRLFETGDWPTPWPASQRLRNAETIVVHRTHISDRERGHLDAWRSRGQRVVLCLGRLTRCHDITMLDERVDLLLDEATAPDILPLLTRQEPAIAESSSTSRTGPRSQGRVDRPGTTPKVIVVSTNRELGTTLIDLLADARYAALHLRRPSADPIVGSSDRERSVILWDVPVLEPGWPDLLGQLADSHRVVALLGLADRETVALARSRGAEACLGLPGDLLWLIPTLERLVGSEIPTESDLRGVVRLRCDRPTRRQPSTHLRRIDSSSTPGIDSVVGSSA